MKIKILYISLLIVFLCDLVFVCLNKTTERFITKPFLMPLLILIYVLESKKRPNLLRRNYFLMGLIFSFFGDFFLLFKWGFLPGLGSFLTAHIFYIICFKNLTRTKLKPIYLISICLYLILLLTFLFPYLKEMKIPVIIYGITISTMLYFSLKTANKMFIFGAFLFVISDSVLATYLFVKQDFLLNFLLMLTYVFAQFCFVKGVLNEENSTQQTP